MNRGIIGARIADRQINRANSYSFGDASGSFITTDDIYSLSLPPSKYFKDKNSNFNLTSRLYSERGNNFINVSSDLTGNVNAFYVSPEGNLLFVANITTIARYDLSTPFDVTTASLASRYRVTSAAPIEAAVIGLDFTPSGNAMFLTGQTRDSILRFNLSTPWDITTSVFSANALVGPLSASSTVTDGKFANDGNIIYVADGLTDQIFQYDRSSSPYTLPASTFGSTTTRLSTLKLINSSNYSFDVSNDGNLLFLSSFESPSTIRIAKLESPFLMSNNYTHLANINTLDLVYGNTSNANVSQSAHWIFKFGDSGNVLFIANNSGVFNVTLPAPYQFDFYQQQSLFSYLTAVTDGQGFYIKPDGTGYYVTDKLDDIIYQYSMETPWDISTSGLLKTKDHILLEEGSSTDIHFKYDGTKMYVVGTDNSTIFQYSLSTAWDIDTVVYENKLFNVSDFETEPTGIYFSQDGEILYLVGKQKDQIFRFKLTTPWDISTATLYYQFSDRGNVYGPVFNGEGSSYFVIDNDDKTLYQYSVSSPYLIESSQYTGNSFYLGNVTTNPIYFTVEDSGQKFFVYDDSSKSVYKYNFAQPYNISSLTYSNSFLTVSFLEPDTKAFDFSSDGRKMYLIGTNKRRLYEVELVDPYIFEDVLWKAFTANVPSFYHVNTLETNPQAIAYSDEGDKLFVLGQVTDRVQQYSLRVPLRPQTAIRPTSQIFTTASSGASITTPGGFYINYEAKANKLFVVQRSASTGGAIHQFTLSDSGNVYSAVYDYISQSFSNGPQSLAFSSDGKKLYLLQTVNDTVETYDLASPWSIHSISLSNSYSVSSFETIPTAISFNPSGTEMYISGESDFMVPFRLAMPWDVSTAYPLVYSTGIADGYGVYVTPSGNLIYHVASTSKLVRQYSTSQTGNVGSASLVASANVSAQEVTPTGIYVDPYGSNLYIVGTISDTIRQYEMSVPHDLSTLAYVRGFSIAAQSNNTLGLTFKPDGTSFYTSNDVNDRILQYNMSQSWNVQTASYVTALSTLASSTVPIGLDFNDDGSKLYSINQQRFRIDQYNLATPWLANTGGTVAVTSNISAAQSVTGTWNSYSQAPRDIKFYNNGYKAIISSSTALGEFEFSTPYDLSTMTGYRFEIFAGTPIVTNATFGMSGNTFLVSFLNSIYQYDMSVPWNVKTLTHNNKFANVITLESNIGGIFIDNSETKLFVTGSQKDQISSLLLSEAGNVATASYFPVGNLLTLATAPTVCVFNDDGTKLIVSGTGTDTLYTYNLTSSYDITNATLYRSNNLTRSSNPQDAYWGNSGYSLYIVQDLPVRSAIVQAYLPEQNSANSITLPIYTSNTASAVLQSIVLTGDGTRMFALNITNDTVERHDLSVPFMISSASYVGNASISTRETNPTGMYLNPAGNNFFFIGTGTDRVQRFSATANTLTSFAFVNNTNALAEATPQGVTFSPDGQRFYIVGDTQDRVYQYFLATPFTLVAAPTLETSFSVAADTTIPTEVRFDVSGTYMYITDFPNNRVLQYQCTTPYFCNTAVLINTLTLSTGAVSTASGIEFSNDGKYMYICTTTGAAVYQYTMETPWDISTAYIDYFILPTETAPTGITMSPDGGNVYVVGTTLDTIFQYPLATPWRLSSLIQTPTQFSISAFDPTPGGLTFSPSGNALSFVGLTQNSIFTVDVLRPYDISSISGSPTDLTIRDTAPSGLHISEDGNDVVIYGDTNKNFVSYNISPPNYSANSRFLNLSKVLVNNLKGLTFSNTGELAFGITDGSHLLRYEAPSPNLGINVNITHTKVVTVDSTMESIHVSPDRSNIYIAGSATDAIYRLFTNDANNISNSEVSNSFSVSSLDTTPTGVFLKIDDGSKLYAIGTQNNKIHEWSLSNNWDISSPTFEASFSLDETQETLFGGIFMSRDGLNLYVVGSSTNTVYRYTLGTPYVLSSISDRYTSFSVSSQSTDTTGIFFKYDGSRMYIVSKSVPASIYEYILSTPWDITSATLNASLNISTNENTPTGMFIPFNGRELYVLGVQNKVLVVYNLLQEWTLNGATFKETQAMLSNNRQTEIQNPQDFVFVADGDYLFVIGTDTVNKIHYRNLNTPFSVDVNADAVLSFGIDSSLFNFIPTGFAMKYDGSKMFVLDSNQSRIYEFTLK